MFPDGLSPLLILGFIVVAGLMVATALRSRKPSPQPSAFPYEKQEALFTPAERSFLGVLEQALDNQHRVFGKVNLYDVIKVKPGLPASERQSAFNRISKKHVDFVLCDANHRNILCVIELDDKSHDNKKRQERDEFLEQALNAAGVPLVRFPAKLSYTLGNIREKLSGVVTDTQSQSQQSFQQELTIESTSKEPQQKACPNCGSEMVTRTAKRGDKAGAQFWACSAYPKCRTTLPLNTA